VCSSDLSVSNFTAERRRRLSGALDKWAFAEVMVAILLFLISPFAAAWLGASGLMFAGLAGGVRVSDRILRSKARTEKQFFRPRNAGLCVKVFRRMSVRAHVRAYRSASRPAFACASGSDDSDGGGSESDSSDPPRPSFPFPVTPFQHFAQKLNSFLSSRRSGDAMGCCGLPRWQFCAKEARS
jgi:hypothetical protein